ncbi:hypothetical protein LTR37_017224 [Vermiconidia calcicola]|uniref:Uncharacterized protein n=1 Tax=Vermiconidia calcicola TaxID=1690605 RepID=A0ACC3MKS7_9PEZI|nr:hypothetical protein LTR37_017224 [Vermiconidia calcicola]
MTTYTVPPALMYADTGIKFRDPFGSREVYDERLRESWSSYPQYSDFNRDLTPPPDMENAAHLSKTSYYQQEHGQHHGDYMPHPQTYRAAVAPYLPQQVTNTQYGRPGVSTQPSSRTMSPIMSSRQPIKDDSRVYTRSRSSSQANAIAPSFQIPKSVNDSGGSLSELAAQITCLFWFESSDLLQQVEDSSIPLHAPRQLVPDAKPTTGFRKWVTTILSTTLVAQNVVILALLFIHRLKKLNPSVRGKPGSEYRLLTVALMLGNKFLDDNTYTNKTWAEVSGINVNEVHIMEVEFLSNMKYCLFTSAEDWAKWQSLLGRFASFVDRTSRPQPRNPPAPILPPASSLHLPMALPSPPASNQASPPYASDLAPYVPPYGQYGPTPAPSPLAYISSASGNHQNSRKRSHEDYGSEPPAKRMASGLQDYQSPRPYASSSCSQQAPRLPLPSLTIPPNHSSSGSYSQPTSQAHQLPPLNVPARAMGMVYPNPSTQIQLPQIPALAGLSSQPQSQAGSQYQWRQQTPDMRARQMRHQSARCRNLQLLYNHQLRSLRVTSFNKGTHRIGRSTTFLR